MFDRPHHQKIAKLLALLDPDVMARTDCAFAGGTYISMSLGEFRRSDDLDIICMSPQGYAELRSLLSDDPSALFRKPVSYKRELRMDPYRFHGFLDVDGSPVKLEVFVEHRISVSAVHDPKLGLPCLSIPDLYAEKLLACTDRVLDKSTNSRDIIDLAMMIRSWGSIPAESLAKAVGVYRDPVLASFRKGLGLLLEPDYMRKALSDLDMDPSLAAEITATLEQAAVDIGRAPEELAERDRRALAAGTDPDGPPADPFQFTGREGVAFLHGIEECRDMHGDLSWPVVERIAIDNALMVGGSQPHEIADFLAGNSPGAVYPERHHALLRIAEVRADFLADLGKIPGAR
ncbi:nucleotidyl transferase AbiEii/AbiGii toxin family protein [Paracoccus sp. ME4]|uniref:nucleotidyl transferase AbiEii/AbiGii toxin family protein n=1 Tax=Paracoccus sp. ME4 TaxID=3138066 RepID=UPI00398AFC8C